MDGLEKLNSSIRAKLSFWLAVTILGLALLAGVAAFASAFNEAHELQDDTLRQVAELCAESPQAFLASGDARSRFGSSRENGVIALALPAGGEDLIPASTPDGMRTLRVGREEYRACIKTLDSGTRVLAAQETELRNESAMDSVERTLMPLLVLIPVLLVLVSHLVSRMFKPIVGLAREIDGRAEQDLSPLDPGPLPVEVRPYAVAINRMLERVAGTLHAQGRFIADAAHELRSPLSALSLQAERLGEVELSPEARVRLERLREGIERSRSLLNQLLDLARAQTPALASAPVPLPLPALCRRIVEEAMPLAEARRIDLGASRIDEAQLVAQEMDLRMVVKNLLDNAIRYTPPGGIVDLALAETPSLLALSIEDSGPGIPAPERERVLETFYRIPGMEEGGSGLGLAIVKSVLDRTGWRLRLEDSGQFPSGLKATLLIPR